MFDLTNKTAVVTGGNGGIGLGIARGLAQAGANIVLAARNADKTVSAVRELETLGAKAVGVTTDVTDVESIRSTISQSIDLFGGLDILVNNAGMNIRQRPEEYSTEDFQSVQDINLKGLFVFCREVHHNMATCGGGKIINIGSMASIFGLDWGVSYAASKGGVVQLTKSLAVAWAADNIQVNAILPGWIRTDLTAPIETKFPERFKQVSERIPQQRWGEASDYSGIAVFLASSASDYVTGTAIPIDGGYSVF